MNRINNIDVTYKLVVKSLTDKLTANGYELTTNEYHKESFGSRICVWKNTNEKLAIRLIWDGRDSWFILQESPFIANPQKVSWADIEIIPFDANNFNANYSEEIVKQITTSVR